MSNFNFLKILTLVLIILKTSLAYTNLYNQDFENPIDSNTNHYQLFCCDYFPWSQTSAVEIKNTLGYWMSDDNQYILLVSKNKSLHKTYDIVNFKIYSFKEKNSITLSSLIKTNYINNLNLSFNNLYYHFGFLNNLALLQNVDTNKNTDAINILLIIDEIPDQPSHYDLNKKTKNRQFLKFKKIN